MEKTIKEIEKERKTGMWGFLGLAMWAFLGLGLEIAILIGENGIYRTDMRQWAIWQNCLHWTLTCMVWLSMVAILIKTSKKQYDFDPLSFIRKPNRKAFGIAILITIIGIMVMTLSWKGFKPLMELKHKTMVCFMFQYVYYFCETAIFSLIIIFGQKFGEGLTQKENIPWGGILLAITWGAVHIWTQDLATGIESIFFSILFGIIYLLMKKDIRWSYLFNACIFLL